MSQKGQILELLGDGHPRSVSEIEQATGISRASVNMNMNRLLKEDGSNIKRVSRGVYRFGKPDMVIVAKADVGTPLKVHNQQFRNPRKLEPHPAAMKIDISKEDRDALREDIQKNGIKHAIDINTKGEILDGINRWEMAMEFGIHPIPVIIFEYEKPEQEALHALTANLARRQLTKTQKNLLAHERVKLMMELSGVEQKRDKKGKFAELPTGKTEGDIIKEIVKQDPDLSERQLHRLKRIAEKKPAVLKQIRDGKLTISAAEKALRLPPPEKSKRKKAKSKPKEYKLEDLLAQVGGSIRHGRRGYGTNHILTELGTQREDGDYKSAKTLCERRVLGSIVSIKVAGPVAKKGDAVDCIFCVIAWSKLQGHKNRRKRIAGQVISYRFYDVDWLNRAANGILQLLGDEGENLDPEVHCILRALHEGLTAANWG